MASFLLILVSKHPLKARQIFTFRLLAFVSLLLLFSRSVCPTLCDPVGSSTPGFPALRCLPEPAQTRDHRVGDAIQPAHPLSSPSPPTFNLSQHQALFQ